MELGETSATRNFLSLTSCQWNAHLISVVVAVSANAEMLDPGDKELGKRVSFIFGDGQRNLATACATHIFYLWQRPAQLGDGPRNLLTPGNTELGETSATRNFFF